MNHPVSLAAIVGSTILASSLIAAPAGSQVVNSLDDLRVAIKTVMPGSVIEVAGGTYPLQRDLELKRLKGTATAPITIRAQHPVEFTGDHVVKLRDSEYLVLDGFRFTLSIQDWRSEAIFFD